MKFAITGTSGYVGSALKHYFASKGNEILELRRVKHPEEALPHVVPYSLGDSPHDPRLTDSDVLIHCAYDFSPLSWEDIHRVNVLGSAKLFEAAAAQGVKKLVLISSISAFEEATSLYGRAKLEMEQEAFKHNGVVIRPGLVFGDTPGGMVGTLKRFITQLPIVPQIGGNQQMFLVHQDDLATLIEMALARNYAEHSPLYACHQSSLAFKEILRRLAQAARARRLFLPIPWRFAWLGLKTLEVAGHPIGIKSDSLISMMNPNHNPDFAAAQQIGATFREFQPQA